MRSVVAAIREANRQCVDAGLKPNAIAMSPTVHRELIREMGEPEGSRLLVIGGINVELDSGLGDVIRVFGD